MANAEDPDQTAPEHLCSNAILSFSEVSLVSTYEIIGLARTLKVLFFS